MERCKCCGKDVEDDDKYVINWGWCDDCWEDNIDLDYILNEIDLEGNYKSTKLPPGKPSEKVQRLLNLLKKRL